MKLVILDRDGVINHDSAEYIKSPEEWTPIPGSLEAIARLNRAGCRVVVATNQSGIARGLFDIDGLMAIQARMQHELAEVGGMIEAFFFCPHAPADRCACRKPKPGLLLQVAERLGVPLQDVPAVGDSPRDLRAARAAGARPVLVRTGNGARTEAHGEDLQGVAVYDDLAAFAAAYLKGADGGEPTPAP